MTTLESIDQKIVLYGGGTQNVQLVYSSAVSVGMKIERIVDKDTCKQGTYFYGTAIDSPEWLLEYDKCASETYLVVITVHASVTVKEIKESLIGLKNAVIYTYEEFLEAIKGREKNRLFSFQVHLVDHCNLNCVCCNHFSPLATGTFYLEAEVFERDMCRLSKLTSGDVAEIHLLGGEPLLHPDIGQFPAIARRYFSAANIDFTTNGLKLLTMPKMFFDTCREYQIAIWVTQYPGSTQLSNVIEMLEKEHIPFQLTNSGNSVDRPKEMISLPLTLKGNLDALRSFNHCNICTSYPVREGKIYACPPAAYIDLFNDYFGEHLPGPDVNGVDLFRVNNLQELMEGLSQPTPLCAYCDTLSPPCAYPWCVSKRDISEWTI